MNIKKKFVLKIIVTLIVLTGLFYGGSLVYNKVMNLIPGHTKPPQGTGDPGNVRLNRLAADPIFHSLPPGCHQDGKLQKSPATWDAFYRDWQGLGVTLDFTCPNSSQAVVANYFSILAMKYNWKLNFDSRGIQSSWSKIIIQGYSEDLILSPIGNNYDVNSPSPSWILSGNADYILPK